MVYKGKIIGEQNNCCEDNREVLDHWVSDDEIYLAVICKICGNKWTEKLD